MRCIDTEYFSTISFRIDLFISNDRLAVYTRIVIKCYMCILQSLWNCIASHEVLKVVTPAPLHNWMRCLKYIEDQVISKDPWPTVSPKFSASSFFLSLWGLQRRWFYRTRLVPQSHDLKFNISPEIAAIPTDMLEHVRPVWSIASSCT
jgi:hypothetical protein